MNKHPFIKPIILGKKTFATNLIQAPLAGVSCAPFRDLIWHFGGPAYCVTEMISAKTLLHDPPKRYIYKNKTEGTLCFQLSGNDKEELKQAAILAENQYGADLIDLNCGCPVDKIRRKNCGSKLLAQSQNLYQIIKTIKTAINIPLTIKIRVDGNSGDQFNTDVVKAINDAGADAIIVHGRNWQEHYETPVRLDEITNIVASSKIPVIGNGDVKDYASLTKMFKQTQCAGIMIARASVGQPWLFQQLIHEDRAEPYQRPSTQEIGKLFLQHIESLSQLANELQATLQARNLIKYYLRAANLDEGHAIKFHEISKLQDLQSLTFKLFKQI